MPLKRAVTSVGYCHETRGCKLAAKDLIAANGIASDGNGTFYVANTAIGAIQVMNEQKDHTLIEGETIYVGKFVLSFPFLWAVLKLRLGVMVDNLSLDSNGALYAGGMLSSYLSVVF